MFSIDWSVIISGAVAILTAGISGMISYRLAVRKARDAIKQLRLEQNLNIKREASLFSFQQKYELFERLSSGFVDMVDSASQLFLVVDYEPLDSDELVTFRQKRFRTAGKAHDRAKTLLRSAYPFIDEDVYNSGMDLLSLAHKQIEGYRLFRISEALGKRQTEPSILDKYYKYNQELYPQLDKFLSLLRDPLDALALVVTEGDGECSTTG